MGISLEVRSSPDAFSFSIFFLFVPGLTCACATLSFHGEDSGLPWLGEKAFVYRLQNTFCLHVGMWICMSEEEVRKSRL